ncbi:MAG: hypothetical protein JSW62_00870 [Thermoplasmatales archaeon]|nr:MAG: hypothetical protein JSW62_00870 [Thermoplasmatales archaeon]
MSGFIWHWKNGNSKVFTKKVDIVEKAIREGIPVKYIKEPSRIIKNQIFEKKGK